MSEPAAHVHVIHENAEWSAPLFAELEALGTPYRDWHLDSGLVRLDDVPPDGVFYSRMSASSHTRGHRYAPELTAAVLAWLEGAGARVLNPSSALRLELSKVVQYAALERAGIRTPKTLAAVGHESLVEAARSFDGPFITKHNRAGKGLGVMLYQSADELQRHLASGAFTDSVDGVNLVQHYVQAPTPHITRVEFIGQKLLYAVRVDTSEGFELCPADACEIGDRFCPAGTDSPATTDSALAKRPKFEIIEGFTHPLVDRYRRFLVEHNVHVAAFEFIEDTEGRAWTYDVNTNTNYNSDAEKRAGVFGMRVLARMLTDELASLQRKAHAQPQRLRA